MDQKKTKGGEGWNQQYRLLKTTSRFHALYLTRGCALWKIKYLLGEGIFLGALLFWLTIMLPSSRRKGKYKAMTHGCNEAPKRTTIFYQDYLTVMTNNGNETTIPYSDLIGYQETKNLHILNCKNNIHVLLNKYGYSISDFDTIKNYFDIFHFPIAPFKVFI